MKTVTPEPGTFEEHILRVVDKFLQTVVVIDDRAFTNSSSPRMEFEEPVENAPGGRAVQGGLEAPKPNNEHDDGSDEHDLDARKVTDAFARSGLICGLLEPERGADLDEALLQGARRADLIVLDWVFHQDEGRKALKIVQNILGKEGAQAERQRLRTIAIYTGQSKLNDIASQLRAVVEKVYPGEDLREYDNGLTLMKGPVRIAVFAKENAQDLPDDLSDRCVPFDELPDRMRREFSALTKGLITAVALAALAALRDDTHRILKVLDPGLDAAYVGNRSVMPVPIDAQRLAVRLVAAEMASVIEDHDIGDQVNDRALSLWLDQARSPSHRFGQFAEPAGKTMSIEQVREMVCRGLGTNEGLNIIQGLGDITKGQWKEVMKQPAYVFSETKEEAKASDTRLIQRLTLKTMYTLPERILSLGTIVRAPNGDYLVCVQPVCDSVRLSTEVRPFPFLKLQTSDRYSRSHYALPVSMDSDPQYVFLKTNPRDIVMARFKPLSGQDTIKAVLKDGQYVFRDTSNKRFRWICQLKSEFAQKIAVDLAQEFARVAVDEAEALRLSRKMG